MSPEQARARRMRRDCLRRARWALGYARGEAGPARALYVAEARRWRDLASAWLLALRTWESLA